MIDSPLYFNGINGENGDYALPPMNAMQLFNLLQGVTEPENQQELEARTRWLNEEHLTTIAGIDPDDVAQAGWGIIFAQNQPADQPVAAIKEALQPLLTLRQEQAGELMRIYEGEGALQPGESKMGFLIRHRVAPADPANPEKMPYYLLLVADPETIPYRFQAQLGVQYAVGRIHFETLEEYANYAAGVVAAERREVELPRQIAFFATRHNADRATHLSSARLIQPLLDQMQPQFPEWDFSAYLQEAASKAQLANLLGGSHKPALLFSASHGMGFPAGSKRQIPHQGALLCREWPGPTHRREAIPAEYYFAGDDLTQDADLSGMIACFFACFGGGTPRYDEFPNPNTSKPRLLTDTPFIARLPMRMLSRHKGSALAVVAHIERTWGSSFIWGNDIEQTGVFQSMLTHLMQGQSVGVALEHINSRYATWATELNNIRTDIQFGMPIGPVEANHITRIWTAHNDARGYAILGDPAVRLPLA